ncbi:hypothetical protein AB0K00_54080 [Dactylosporangium sp. NPDC049525]|uniref:hypothetical protein n=1 Tax=Dactylosporangium sp. NPDC049525 TaxID=3154730 RepID=UPI00341B9C24
MTDTIRTRARRRGVAAVFAAAALAVTLAACGSGSADPQASQGDQGSGQLSLTEWQLKFAACMRGEGIAMPDPDAPGQMALGGGVDPAAVQAAAGKCRGELGDPPAMSQEEQAAADQQFLEWARGVAVCYRDNGYDMPDPVVGEELQFPSDVPQEIQDQCGGGSGSVTRRNG